MVVPGRVSSELDTLSFCNLVDITTEDFERKLIAARKYSKLRPSAFIEQISAEEWTKISPKLFEFEGFYGQKRTLRKYPESMAAHVLGYIGEVDAEDISRDPYYQLGDYIGISGLEKTYENELRGTRGIRVYTRDVHNRLMESYNDGALDRPSIPGNDITTTLDAELQVYGEQLMQNKKGSIVAIEPATGEILALVTSPGYDPNILVGRKRALNYESLVANDSLNPLFNRALNAVYRPGSIFKLVESLIGLQMGVIQPSTRIPCNRAIINCHGSHTYDDLEGAIQHSCNPYFYEVYKRIIQPGKKSSIFLDSREGLSTWREYVLSFGLGARLDIDVQGSSSGMVPDTSFYDKWYGKNRWAFSTIYSNSIGEGELGVVPIQMANLAAILANRGYYIAPHFVKEIGNGSVSEKNQTYVDSSYFYVVLDALEAVVNKPGGTARRARLDSITVCGKTGTVQNKTTPDHSVFIGFAPRNNPKIAVAVYIENAGFGGTWAAPTASLIMEKFINGSVSDTVKQQRILEANFIDLPVE
jgi:penicillin-binding protein 2